jgi:hypothetical protein
MNETLSLHDFCCNAFSFFHRNMLDCQGGFLAGVSIGGLQLDGSDGTFLGVDEELLHPDYDEPTRFNDIMLVKLSETTDVETIALNLNANVPRLDDPVTVVRFFCWSWSASSRVGVSCCHV